MQCESSGKTVFPIFQFQDSMHDIMLVCADLHVQFTTYHQPGLSNIMGIWVILLHVYDHNHYV